MLAAQATDFVIDHARLNRAAAGAVDAQDDAGDMLLLVGRIEGGNDVLGIAFALGLDDTLQVDHRGVPHVGIRVLAELDRGEQDQEQEKQDGRAEENAPATAGFLLFIGRKEQFFEGLALPGGVGSFLLGGVH